MKRLLLALFAAAALVGLGIVSAAAGVWPNPLQPSAASSFSVSPWAYACGTTTFANPANKTDAACATGDAVGTATASYTAGVLTMSKTGPTSGDLAAGATIGGLTTLTAASFDLVGESYCGAGAPRLNVTTSDGKTHFFGCAANNSGGHVSIDLSAAGDGSGNGGVAPTDTVTAIDFVQDEQGTATLDNLSFEGGAAATPTPSATATPAASTSAAPRATAAPSSAPTVNLAQTGGGQTLIPLVAMAVVGSVLFLSGLVLTWRRRKI